MANGRNSNLIGTGNDCYSTEKGNSRKSVNIPPTSSPNPTKSSGSTALKEPQTLAHSGAKSRSLVPRKPLGQQAAKTPYPNSLNKLPLIQQVNVSQKK